MDQSRTISDLPLFAAAAQRPCTPAATPVQPSCAAPASGAARASRAAPETVPLGHSQGVRGAENAPLAATLPLPPEFVAIWDVLERHRGQATAITAPAIAATAGLWPDATPANRGTRVRKVLELSQDQWPWPVCGDADGYYLAATAEELCHCCASLQSRALCIHRRFASVRNVARRCGFTYLGHGRWADAGKEAPISNR